MKKVLATILAVIYLASSSGATINMHYCMGKFSSLEFVKNDKCSKCGMKKTDKEKGCCHDEVKVMKVQDSHQLISNPTNLSPAFAIPESNYSLHQPALFQAPPAFATNNNSPPCSFGSSLYILHCVFRL